MYNLNRELKMLEESGGQIKIAIIGAGQMGKSLVTQVNRMAGMETIIVIDRDVEEAKDAYLTAGISEDKIKVASTIEEVNKYTDEGYYVVGTDFNIACKSNPAEAVVDATGSIEAGAEIALNTILNKKHIIMLNAETDSVIGPILKKFADEAGVIFTGSAGDEPGAVMELYDFADAMGFEILVIGKGKNNKLDYECTPDTVRDEAIRRGVAPHMLASFKDGSKTMVEMSLMCNATGLVPDIMGAHGIDANLDDVTKKLTLKSEGGVLNKYGVVEYVNGLAPGVFAIITHKDDIIKDEMKYLSMGDGPNYILYRPYHLASLETPLSIAMAVLENKATIAPKGGLVADVITIAKKDLKAGEYMDSYGNYTCYGLIEEYDKARKKNAVPVGLVNEKTKVLKDIKKGEIVTYDMVELDTETTLYHLRKLQDTIFNQ
ncbi:MAG: NAD(P)-dependent oxidoreductase [Tissierellia bacterium]|nr:NAD(P)-dependent oxidoreductase [Tissierellia bacterium]